MRKFWIGVALTGLVVVSAAAGAWAAAGVRKNIEVEYSGIKITVNGKVVEAATGEMEPFLYLAQSRTYVPARPLAEALGAKVGWNQETSTVEVFTPDYVKVATEGEYKVWSMPGQGFSIKVPRGFMRQDLGTSLLQLALPDPTSGFNSVVAISRMDSPGDGSTLQQNLNAMLDVLGQTVFTDLKITSTKDEGTKVTVEGTCAFFGKMPANIVIQVISAGQSDWMIMTAAPSAIHDQMAPVMQDIIKSFTFTQ
ncbi:MAG TPA: copper amine oxidase N-terminal domain-containing protein [Symbiobacteriaceae bacterium]|nr:copper amine oxidase N-terminal domain-containing protein [Symbiobacteriaceae bacterium]